jgi:hypothetical protein
MDTKPQSCRLSQKDGFQELLRLEAFQKRQQILQSIRELDKKLKRVATR